MKIMSPFPILCFLVFLAIHSCKEKSKGANSEFLNQLTQLDEFKRSEKLIDSLASKNAGPMTIGINIVKNPKEDSLKNFSIGYINLDRGVDHIILYTVKFDKNIQKITSVKKNKTGTALNYLRWPK